MEKEKKKSDYEMLKETLEAMGVKVLKKLPRASKKILFVEFARRRFTEKFPVTVVAESWYNHWKTFVESLLLDGCKTYHTILIDSLNDMATEAACSVRWSPSVTKEECRVKVEKMVVESIEQLIEAGYTVSFGIQSMWHARNQEPKLKLWSRPESKRVKAVEHLNSGYKNQIK